jgi:hypothetical protein
MPQSTPSYVQSLRESIRPRNLEGTTLCLVRSVADDSIDASFNFGEDWHAFPLSEIISAETVRTVTLVACPHRVVLFES